MGNPNELNRQTQGQSEGPAEDFVKSPSQAERVRLGRELTAQRDPFALDLQTLLTHSVVRIRDVAHVTTAVAWALRPDGTPYVAAASFDADSPVGPSRGDFSKVSTLDTVSRLDASPGLIEIAERHRLSAAAVVRGAEHTPLAILLVGPEPARPRVLASLGGAAQRLEVPLAAAMAAGRFRQLDRDVRRIDRLAALGKLTAEIAHEVRNPLVSVKTFLQLLPERRADPEFTNGFLDLVNDELRRMERLLDVIIQHAQPTGPSGSQPNSASASLEDAMTAVLALVSHRSDKRGVRLDCDYPDLRGLPRLALDDDGLRQVVLNLLLNAIEATPPGASVRVAADGAADFVTFRIADEGPGIAPELREEIFTAFYSTRAERSGGLGLAITRRIVMEAGGTITAANGERGGAEFTVRVPAVPASTV